MFSGSSKLLYSSGNEIEGSKEVIVSDINEYYGLLSTELNNKGVFHPLYANDVYELKINNVRHMEAFYFVVKVEDVYVLTHFVKYHD